MQTEANEPLRFEDYEKDAKRLARSLLNKSRRAGNPGMELDSLYSDVCMTWVRCRDNYNPELGIPFRHYFVAAATRNYGMFVRDNYDEVRVNSSSLDAPLSEDTSTTFGDSIEDESVDIEALISKRERISHLGERYPILSCMLNLIVNPPDDLQQEIDACQDYAAQCERLGYSTSQQPKMLTFNILQKIFGFNWRQRLRLIEEMEDASKYID